MVRPYRTPQFVEEEFKGVALEAQVRSSTMD